MDSTSDGRPPQAGAVPATHAEGPFIPSPLPLVKFEVADSPAPDLNDWYVPIVLAARRVGPLAHPAYGVFKRRPRSLLGPSSSQ